MSFSLREAAGRNGKVKESLLLAHLRMAVKETERLYELAMSDDAAGGDWEQSGLRETVDAHLKVFSFPGHLCPVHKHHPD